eukprot:COSAG05_NODE_1556_length_4568_cov_2.886776_7_plen_84_part_00
MLGANQALECSVWGGTVVDGAEGDARGVVVWQAPGRCLLAHRGTFADVRVPDLPKPRRGKPCIEPPTHAAAMCHEQRTRSFWN